MALTLEQLEDAHGLPIVLLSGFRRSTGKPVQLTVRDLPLAAIAIVLKWLNDNQ